MKNIIYDFNGTIVDDVECCLMCINELIKEYLNRDILTLKEYKNVFRFPVKEYYELVGFDFNILNWEEVGNKFHQIYNANYDKCRIFPEALQLLKENKERGNLNICLSATEINALHKQLKDYQIHEYFDVILGIDNCYGTSKIAPAIEYMKDKNKQDYILIGDTLHDLQVAKEIGVDCILISSGHQSKEVLLKEYDKVVDNISEVIKCV